MAYVQPTKIRRPKGASIIELLVSIMVISVAIAGLTELTWINTSWNARLFNKIDNHYAARRFLERIGKEIRNANAISTESTSTKLVLLTAEYDSEGFLKPVSSGGIITKISYTLSSDGTNQATGNALYMVTRETYNQSSGAVDSKVEQLNGIVGPLDKTTNQIALFQYKNSNSSNLSKDAAIGYNISNPVDAVIVNLELQRLDYGGKRTYSATSGSIFGLRDEFVLRNMLVRFR